MHRTHRSVMKVGSQIAECSLSFAIRYKITIFKKLKGVTTCNIVVMLYWWYVKVAHNILLC